MSSSSLSVPMSMHTGRHTAGATPAHAVYNDSLEIGPPMACTPTSPTLSMLSPSVATMSFTLRSGQFFRILGEGDGRGQGGGGRGA